MSLTPEQFNKIALKEDLNRFATKEELFGMKNEILEAIDNFAQKVEISEVERCSNISAHDRFEQRITKIEKQVGLAMAV